MRSVCAGHAACNSATRSRNLEIISSDHRFMMCSARFSTFNAASLTASLKVGCEWQVRPISSELPPNSITETASAINSEAAWRSGRGAGAPGAASAKAGARERTSSERTVYVLSFGQPKPVQIKTGISDGVVTEVVEGLKEGDRVVTAEMAAKSQPASTPPNPFSGGQRRFP